VGGTDELLRRRVVQKREQMVIVAAGFSRTTGLRVKVEQLPGDDLEQLLKVPKPPGRR
jgi:hypothetical protein